MAWFSLTGSDPTIPNDYKLVSSAPSCGGQDQICAVQADNNGSNEPELTETLKDEMIIALHNSTESTNVKLRG